MGYLPRTWTPQKGKTPTLSIRQPFLEAIMQQKKMIELRTWMIETPELPLWIALHAGKLWYGDFDSSKKMQYTSAIVELERLKPWIQALGLPKTIPEYPTSAVVGMARLVRCWRMSREEYTRLEPLHRSNAAWDRDTIGWQFDKVVRLPEPLPMRGYPGIFAIDEIAVPEISERTNE